MQQVWDFFELLSDEDQQHVHWILENATFSSPFVISAKPIDTQTKELAYDVIDPIVEDIASTLTKLSSLQSRPDNLSDKKQERIRRLLERNTNGIEMTEYDFGRGIEPVTIDHNSAERSLELLNKPSKLDLLMATFAHQEYGAIMGSLLRLGTYYKQPAIYVKDFDTEDSIWCQVDKITLEDLNEKIRAKHVWERQDVLVEGLIDYDSNGKITHITDGAVSYIDRKQVSLEELHDPDFSEGLSSEEYLERLRED